MASESGVKGLLINRIKSLDEEESRLLRESFPQLDISKVLILEQNRKPSSVIFSFGAMGLGVFVVLTGLVSLKGERK